MDNTGLFQEEDELYEASVDTGTELVDAMDIIDNVTQAVLVLFHTAVRGPISRDTTMRIMTMLSPDGMLANSLAYLRYVNFIDSAQMALIVEKISELPTEVEEDAFSGGLSA